jgi:YD repeat-containing protein
MDNGDSIINETNYTYNSRDLIKSTSSVVNNSTLIENVAYPFDCNSSLCSTMVEKNMINYPLKKEIFRDSEKISSTEIVYKNWISGVIAPELVKTSKGALTLENRLKYNNYDEKGNLLEVQQENNVKVSYIWGYNKTLPVAKLENISYNNIPVALITAIQTATNSNIANEIDILYALNGLRISTDANMVKAMITTYTYKPLVGLTTLTDPKGDTQTFTYDSFGRLQYVKDNNGNILNENEYHFRP